MHVTRTVGYDVESFRSTGVRMEALPPTDDRGVQVHVAHVAAGGTIGRHPAVRSQAFVVVSGTATVAGHDGGRRELGAGEMVVWAPGEQHQTWAVTDLVAVVVECDRPFDLVAHLPH
ncbi:cupin domain-containing protein [Cellulomonas sp. HZM]|uniref:cupin domain-containing protein n=1 Tax=Cellulomonas sp. HZM TaxID=1454010 RepID=UPI0006921BD4|nr:cupin domain-containing protein [Cellulomonas sp. HZM]